MKSLGYFLFPVNFRDWGWLLVVFCAVLATYGLSKAVSFPQLREKVQKGDVPISQWMHAIASIHLWGLLVLFAILVAAFFYFETRHVFKLLSQLLVSS